MRIAIVAPSPIPFGPGGAEAVWAGLYHELLTNSPHDVELIKIPIRETTLGEVMAAYEAFATLDVSHFDLVITGKYPAWMVRHPRHVVYMLHPLRGLYDSYHYFDMPEQVTSNEPETRRLVARAASLGPSGLPGLLGQWRAARAALGPDHPDLQFPGPLARTLVHAMDGVGLSTTAVSRYLAISRTVARRTDYFPPGVPVRVVHPPSDLSGLHEAPGEYFFTASRHDAPKRLDLLIKGMQHYPGERRLLIAGSGPDMPRLQALAAGDSRVELVGRLSQDELIDHYAHAVGVPFIPLDEDLGLITIEAMASGKPVLTAHDSGGPTEFVRTGLNGFVVDPSPEAIGAGLTDLERLGSTPSAGDAARRAVRGITWARVADELVGHSRSEPTTRARTGLPRLVVTSTFPLWPPRNGGQLRAYHLYGALTSQFDIDVVCLAQPNVPASTRTLREGFVEHVVPRSAEHEAREIAITHDAGLPVTDIVAGRLTSLTPVYGALLSDLLEGAAGVILADPFLYPMVEATAHDVPFVYDAFNCEYILKSQMLPDTATGRELLDEVKRVERAASVESRLVMSVSAEDRSNLNELYGTPDSRFVLAPNGLDLPRVPYTPMPQRRQNRERWLAALRAKGSGHGLRSLAAFVGSWHLPNNEAARTILELAREMPDVGFLLLGSHTMSLRRLPLPANVFLFGEVSDAVKTTVLATADVALAPLTSGSGTNLKVVEYLGAGVPVVSTRVGVRGLDVPQECIRVASIEQFAVAIRAELAASDAQERALRARLAVERRYDWAAIAARVAPRIKRALAVG